MKLGLVLSQNIKGISYAASSVTKYQILSGAIQNPAAVCTLVSVSERQAILVRMSSQDFARKWRRTNHTLKLSGWVVGGSCESRALSLYSISCRAYHGGSYPQNTFQRNGCRLHQRRLQDVPFIMPPEAAQRQPSQVARPKAKISQFHTVTLRTCHGSLNSLWSVREVFKKCTVSAISLEWSGMIRLYEIKSTVLSYFIWNDLAPVEQLLI